MAWQSKPNNAWVKYGLANGGLTPGWVEDSKAISNEIAPSKRELFCLVLMAYMFGGTDDPWRVGFDPDEPEPNDGFVVRGESRVNVEHKLIAQMEREEVLQAILDIYRKTEAKGRAYGQDRMLVIQPNKSADHGGMVRISDLRELIGDESPFDRVFSLSIVRLKENGRIAVVSMSTGTGRGIAAIEFDLATGLALVPHVGIDTP